MRPWRKLFREHLSSSRLRSVSTEARWLWVMLISAQDDDAVFPWGDEAQLSMLLAGTTQWTVEDRERLASELEEVGLIAREDGFVFLYRGEDFNGHLRKDNNPFYYRKPEQRELEVNQRITSSQPVVALEKKKTRLERDKEGEGEKNNSAVPSSNSKKEPVDDPLLKILTSACTRDFGAVEAGMERVLKKFADSHPELSIEWAEMAFDEAARNGAISWSYVAKVLETWIDRGEPGKPTKEKRYGKSGQDSSDDANSKRPGSGFEPLGGGHARAG